MYGLLKQNMYKRIVTLIFKQHNKIKEFRLRVKDPGTKQAMKL